MSYNLTKAEALQAMKDGNKVTREYFSSDEYIYINLDTRLIQSEDGFNFTEWWVDTEPTIPKTDEKCWNIFS